ncbi:hypothetical protein BGZ61DRAFT_451911 [Ilyonectria robusta]|uniref:uncharacterized protein n=1 Tax=Ilyonectria robusta TaxID=1079257 RepID=UPI001E8CA243|nr:uncharacterized protein BGZ61DRAFT_451911 [Ilyonectria robusta]KAH8694438.1 hypothetical protein BGZ61DRAFT_451911 [Ilyonectria robusta]
MDWRTQVRRIPLIIASDAVGMAIPVEKIHCDFGIPPPKGEDNTTINCPSERSVYDPRPNSQPRRHNITSTLSTCRY